MSAQSSIKRNEFIAPYLASPARYSGAILDTSLERLTPQAVAARYSLVCVRGLAVCLAVGGMSGCLLQRYVSLCRSADAVLLTWVGNPREVAARRRAHAPT